MVGSGIWTGEQLNIVSVGSVDLCNINGVQLSGYVEGNPLIIKIYRPKNGLDYLTEISWDLGFGYFGVIIQSFNTCLTAFDICFWVCDSKARIRIFSSLTKKGRNFIFLPVEGKVNSC